MKLNNDSKKQLDDIVKFVCRLVFKDQKVADSKETPEATRNASAYMLAYSRQDDLTDEQRRQIIDNYEELNEYYKFLKDTYGIEPYIARTKRDYQLLYYPQEDIIENSYLLKYKDIYNEVWDAFYRTTYTNTMEDIEGYRSLVLATMNLNAIIKLMHIWMEHYFDVDIMTSEMVENFLLSFGIYQFRDLPISYKRKIAKNLNRLIVSKGTDEVIISILDIFEFKNIDVYKYHLVAKSIEEDINGKKIFVNNPRFYSHNIRIPSLSVALKTGEFKSEPIEAVVSGDKYWHNDKETISSQDFDYIQTKYFSIEYSKEMISKGKETTYFINLLEYIRINENMRENMFLTLGRFDNTRISLYDTVVLLQSLVNLIYINTTKVMEEDYGNPREYAFSMENHYVGYEDLEIPLDYRIKTIPQEGSIDINTVQSIFNHNRVALRYTEELLRKETNYKRYRRLLAYYRRQFFNAFNNSLVIKTYDYNDYFGAKIPLLKEFLDDIVSKENIEERNALIKENILYLIDVINAYCNEVNLQFSSINASIEIGYLKRIINVFKSFTVTLRELNSVLELKDDVEFRLLDDTNFIGLLSITDYADIELCDYYTFTKLLELYTWFKLNDRMDLTVGLTHKDRIELRDFLQSIQSILSERDFVRLNDQINDILVNETIDDTIEYDDIMKIDHVSIKIKEQLLIDDIFETFSLLKIFDEQGLHLCDHVTMKGLQQYNIHLRLRDYLRDGIQIALNLRDNDFNTLFDYFETGMKMPRRYTNPDKNISIKFGDWLRGFFYIFEINPERLDLQDVSYFSYIMAIHDKMTGLDLTDGFELEPFDLTLYDVLPLREIIETYKLKVEEEKEFGLSDYAKFNASSNPSSKINANDKIDYEMVDGLPVIHELRGIYLKGEEQKELLWYRSTVDRWSSFFSRYDRRLITNMPEYQKRLRVERASGNNTAYLFPL